MKRAALLTPLFTAFGVLSHPAFARAEAADAFTINDLLSNVQFWGSVVNSALLIGLAWWFTRKKIAQAMQERRAAIADQLEEAKKIHEAAEKRHQEYQERLAHLDKELAELKVSILRTGESERDRLIKEAEEKAERMRGETRGMIESRLRQLEKDLHEEAIKMAIDAARAELESKTTADDQTRLAKEYLAAVNNLGATLKKEARS